MPSWLRDSGAAIRLDVRVVPRARRNVIDGLRDGRLLVRVTAPPVDRAANDAVAELLAAALGVPRRAVRIVTGETARHKTIEVAGVSRANAAARLGQPLTP